jgi:hypothetical protein
MEVYALYEKFIDLNHVEIMICKNNLAVKLEKNEKLETAGEIYYYNFE